MNLNPIISGITFRPDYDKLEKLANDAYIDQPGIYMSAQTRFDEEISAKYAMMVAAWEEKQQRTYNRGDDFQLW